MLKYLNGFFACCMAMILYGCTTPKQEENNLWDPTLIIDHDFPERIIESINFSEIPYKNLSDYGFFKGKIRELVPNEGVMLYSPSSSLFTDYAFKSRFIWMPEGAEAYISEDLEGSIELPENTILIKNFYYPIKFSDPKGPRRIIETRLMIKQKGQWEAYPYLWKDDQSDAEYKVTGAEIRVDWQDEKGNQQVINYLVPNKNQCKSCHNINQEMVPIGVKAKYLNHEISFGEGYKNQLKKWEEFGFLKNMKAIHDYPNMVDYYNQEMDLELRAKAYLDINCGHCHRQEGPASTSGLFLTYEEKDPLKLGIFKTPVAAGIGAGSFKYDIVPGKAEESILTYRMETNIVGAAMPEIGRVTTHQEGVELIKNWINTLKD